MQADITLWRWSPIIKAIPRQRSGNLRRRKSFGAKPTRTFGPLRVKINKESKCQGGVEKISDSQDRVFNKSWIASSRNSGPSSLRIQRSATPMDSSGNCENPDKIMTGTDEFIRLISREAAIPFMLRIQ